MEIRILELIEGAKEATGLTVIIDVFRAFSTDCYVFRNGAERIYPVGNIQLAYQLKEQHPDYILMGERGGIIQPGFDYGNSPTLIENVDFQNKIIVQTTSAGTQGFANAHQADEIITGSFVNAAAIASYIRQQKPEIVSFVAMGTAGAESTAEDFLCAQYLKSYLENKPVNFQNIKKYLHDYKSAIKFFDPKRDWAPERDFELCMNLSATDFVIKASTDSDGMLYLEKLTI